MTLTRSVIFFIFFVINTIVFATLGLIVCWFLPSNARFIIDTNWSRLTLWGLKLICGLTYRLEGEENLPKQSCIILANHQSAWETIALASIIQHPKVWVLKRELTFIPIFGWVMIHFKPIAIDRKSGRKAIRQIIDQGTERLKAGLCVIIFPEGTRVPPGEKKSYGIGAAMLAEHSGFPIVPIAHNAGVFWKRRGIKKYPGVIEIRIGNKIDTKNKKAQEINNIVKDWIETNKTQLPLTKD